MNDHSTVSRWLLSAGVTIALLAPFTWAQNDQPATTSPGSDSTAARQEGQVDSKGKDNTAKFDTKTKEASTDIVKRMNNAAGVLDEIMGTPDKGIPKDILADAKCIAVIPSMVNIAVGIGGRHGKGVATCRTTHGWSAPAPITITGGSWGLQIGGEATDLVMLVMNQRGMDHLLSSKFKIGGDVAVAAGPVGRHAEAATDVAFKSEILTYSRARGVFAGISLNGTEVSPDEDSTRAFYGRNVPFEDILAGKVKAPAEARTFLASVRQAEAQTAAAKSTPSKPR